TRTPARMAVGGMREYAVRASPSAAPSRKGHAVCQTPWTPVDSWWLARPMTVNSSTATASATAAIGQAWRRTSSGMARVFHSGRPGRSSVADEVGSCADDLEVDRLSGHGQHVRDGLPAAAADAVPAGVRRVHAGPDEADPGVPMGDAQVRVRRAGV